MRSFVLCVVAALGVVVGGATSQAAENRTYPIAGVDPSSRPAGAPVLSEVKKDGAWFAQALKGIEGLYPPSIEQMVKDQGNWYTPFTVRGMPGRYDIRRLFS